MSSIASIIAKESPVPRWEYLRVRIRGDHASPTSVALVGDDGNYYEWKKELGDKDNAPVMRRVLQRLGEDGWELTSIAPTGETGLASILYFKRPKL